MAPFRFVQRPNCRAVEIPAKPPPRITTRVGRMCILFLSETTLGCMPCRAVLTINTTNCSLSLFCQILTAGHSLY